MPPLHTTSRHSLVVVSRRLTMTSPNTRAVSPPPPFSSHPPLPPPHPRPQPRRESEPSPTGARRGKSRDSCALLAARILRERQAELGGDGGRHEPPAQEVVRTRERRRALLGRCQAHRRSGSALHCIALCSRVSIRPTCTQRRVGSECCLTVCLVCLLSARTAVVVPQEDLFLFSAVRVSDCLHVRET